VPIASRMRRRHADRGADAARVRALGRREDSMTTKPTIAPAAARR
jgi:hypothetical protein